MGCSKNLRTERLPTSMTPVLSGLEALIPSYPKDKPEDRPTSRTLTRNLRSEYIPCARPPRRGLGCRCLRHSRLLDQPPHLGEGVEHHGMPASTTTGAARNSITRKTPSLFGLFVDSLMIQPPSCRRLCWQTQRTVFPTCLEWFLLLL